MNARLILFVSFIAGLSSCTTMYKIEQTPDDVYYSPAPPQNGYVQTNNEEDRNAYNNASAEDREILRRINNRRWRRHNYDYNDITYSYGYIYPYGYYPYGNNYPVYVNPKTSGTPSTYAAPRKYNLGAFGNPPANTFTLDPKTGKITNAPKGAVLTGSGTPVRTFAKPSGSAVGNFIRKVISSPEISSGSNNTNNTTQSRSFEPAKSSSPSPAASSSRSSSSGSSAPVRTFTK